MHPEDPLLALFDDLEQQAAGLGLADRETEVDELAQGEYAQVTLAGRLQASRGSSVSLRLWGQGPLSGSLERVGADWVQLDDPRGTTWLVRTAAVLALAGLVDRAVAEEAAPVTARLSLRSALRAWGSEGRECAVHLLDGGRVEGFLGRVGHDFVEVLPPARRPDAAAAGREVVPLPALVCVRELR